MYKNLENNNLMAKFTGLLVVLVLLLAACDDVDRNGITNSCPDSPAFVIDLSTPGFFGLSWFWINNSKQE
ncbi:MAG: hypothetical protein AAGJ93_07900, partial [Bacteroidota bacterium]